MREPTRIRVQFRPGLLGWALVLVGFLATFVVAVFAVGLLLLLIPVVAAAAFVRYFVWRWRLRRTAAMSTKDSAIIDAEYRVVDPRDAERQPPGGRLT